MLSRVGCQKYKHVWSGAKHVCRHFTLGTPKLEIKEVEEVKIPTPWGHIAGKWWGPSNQRPILAIHGWQDNAGSFDTLIPLLPQDISILAIDLPGHGLSSWLPNGSCYDNYITLSTVRRIVQYFNWKKVSFLSHSMGSIVSFRYASIYPKDVEFYIGFDTMTPEYGTIQHILETMPSYLDKLLRQETLSDSEPPSYTKEELCMRYHLGTDKSVSLESSKILTERGSRPSQIEPERYYFSRDSALKYGLQLPVSSEYITAMTKQVICPVMCIKATDSVYGLDDDFNATKEYLRKNNKFFEFHTVEGTHHVHLNNPSIVAPLVTNFIRKHQVSKD